MAEPLTLAPEPQDSPPGNFVEQNEPAPAAKAGPAFVRDKEGKVYKTDDLSSAVARGYEPATPEQVRAWQVTERENRAGPDESALQGVSSLFNQMLLGVPQAIQGHEATPEQA